MKNRKREICTSGTVRDEAGNILIYSANDRGDRGDVGIIRSPVRASILPDHDQAALAVKIVAVIARGWSQQPVPLWIRPEIQALLRPHMICQDTYPVGR